MRKAYKILLWLLISIAIVGAKPNLKACSDPNSPPLFKPDGSGIYNKIEEWLIKYYGGNVQRYLFPMQRGFVRNTLVPRKCNFVVGMPMGYELILSTRPLFKSSYVLVYRSDSGLDIKGIDDPILKKLRIGIIANAPPAYYLRDKGLADNFRSYSYFYDSLNTPELNPNLLMIKDLLEGRIDVAVMWGPIAGPLVKEYKGKLKMILAKPNNKKSVLLEYKVTVGVRKGEYGIKRAIERALMSMKGDIYNLLVSSNVPILECDNCIVTKN